MFPADKFDLLALLGTATVLLGAFAPAADVAIYGTVSYWEAAGPEAVFMIACAVVAVVLLARKQRNFARIAAIGMWVALLWPYLQGLMEPAPDGFLEEAASAVVDTTTGFATDIALNFVDITWGTLALAAGCLMVTLGTLVRRKQ